MSRPRSCFAAGILSALTLSASLQAQGKDRFVQSLESFSNAVAGTHGDEGPVLLAAVDGMRAGLEAWDALIASVESRFAAEIGAAPAPAAARMRAALGSVYLERGRVDAALAQFATASGLDARFAEVELLRALALRLANRPAEAAAASRSLWLKAPGVPAHAYLLLRSLEDDDASVEGKAARAALEAAVAQARPSDRATLLPALGVIDDGSVSAPVFPPAAYSEAFASLRAGEYDRAVARLRETVPADPLVSDKGLHDPAVRDAIARLKRQESTAAEALADAASRLPSSEVHRLLGLVYWDRKQYGDSVEQLRRSVRLDPANERARLALADVLVDAGDPAGARSALVEAAMAMPKSGLARWKLGRLSQLMGDERGALEAFEAAAGLPAVAGEGHVRTAIGRLYHNQLDLDAAAAAYARRVELTPNDSAAHLDLGEVYRAQGRLGAAMTELLAAALLDPAGAPAFAAIGQLHVAAARDAEAEAALRRAVELDPTHREARYALSRALMRLGRPDEARAELEVFEQLQAKAMEEERRRFRENQMKIDDALKAGERPGAAR